MKTQFFNPNWRAINEAIQSEGLKELRKAQKELGDKIQDKVNAFYKAKRMQEQADKTAALKALPKDSVLYFTGRSTRVVFGAECIKVLDAIKYMTVTIDGKRWKCPYIQLKIDEATEQEIKDEQACVRLSNLVNATLK